MYQTSEDYPKSDKDKSSLGHDQFKLAIASGDFFTPADTWSYAWMGKRCWPWDHQWMRTWQRESPALAQFDKEHLFGRQTAIFIMLEQRRWAIVWTYGRSYFCLLNVIFGCVSTEISIQFSTRSFPNRIEFSANLLNLSIYWSRFLRFCRCASLPLSCSFLRQDLLLVVLYKIRLYPSLKSTLSNFLHSRVLSLSLSLSVVCHFRCGLWMLLAITTRRRQKPHLAGRTVRLQLQVQCRCRLT